MFTKSNRSLFVIIVLVLGAVVLVGCASDLETPIVAKNGERTATKFPTSTPLPTNTKVHTHTPTNIPSLTPTQTPTPIPAALQGTPFSFPAAVISKENADQVSQLARWGNGVAYDVQYSPDGKFIVVSSTIGLYLYDAETRNLIKTFEVYSKGPEIVDFLQDGESLALLLNGQVEIISFPEGYLLERFGENVESVAFSDDGELVAMAYCSGEENCSETLVKTYSRKALDLIDTFEVADRPRAVTLSPNGTLLGLRTRWQVLLWRLTDKTQLLEYGPTTATMKPYDIEFSPDGKYFAISTYTDVRLYSTENGTLVNETGLRNSVRQNSCIEFSPDGKYLAIGSSNLFIWSIDSGSSVHMFSDEYLRQHGAYTDLSWSPSGDTIITASYFDAQPYLYSTTLWDVASLSPIGNLEGFDSPINKIIWSPDSTFFGRDIAFGWN
jgi:WD40 repeat protein